MGPVRPQMGKIKQSGFTRVLVGADLGLKAIEVETAFERNGQSLWQRQLAFKCRKNRNFCCLHSLRSVHSVKKTITLERF